MENVKIRLSGHRMFLEVRLDESHGVTRAGKIRVASSGNCPVWKSGQPDPSGLTVNLNVWRNPTPEERAKLLE